MVKLLGMEVEGLKKGDKIYFTIDDYKKQYKGVFDCIQSDGRIIVTSNEAPTGECNINYTLINNCT